MRIHAILITTIALCLGACGQRDAPAPHEEVAEPVEDSMSAPEESDATFVNHMHWHAEKLDDLMFALADGDLEGAMTPAYWLSRHDTVEGLPEELQPHLTGMREAALAVEAANNLDTARAAAEELSGHCQACHTAAGVSAME